MTLEQRYRAVVEYDGTDFVGYQVQAKGRTVQGEIEESLKRVTQSAIRIDGAGRTDAGVHATGQVIAFNAIWRHTLEDLHRALNAVLPDDIVIRDLKATQPSFHPRFEALSRTYHYQIINQLWPAVLLRRYAYHLNKALDVRAMNEASRFLLGQHDFASFGKPPQGHNTVRNVIQAEWGAAGEGRIVFEITANAFLYRMVRTLVGTLVQVGLGLLPVNDVKYILETRDLTKSAAPAPAHGLCLVNVAYPEDM